jgi:hypothetical protein
MKGQEAIVLEICPVYCHRAKGQLGVELNRSGLPLVWCLTWANLSRDLPEKVRGLI